MPWAFPRCRSRLYTLRNASRLLRAVAVGEGGGCEPEGRGQDALARVLPRDGTVAGEVDLVSEYVSEQVSTSG